MDRILITGFEPFLGHPVNPSALLAEALDGTVVAGARVSGVQLPVSYDGAGGAFAAAFDRVRPDAVLLFGLAFEEESIRLERVALNLDDTTHPDNLGQIRRGRPIAEDGPVGYWSTLPLDTLADRLTEAGFPARTSRDAGGYLCNHLFFRARHLIAGRGLAVPAGFVHVPPLEEQVADRPGRTGITLLRLVEAARLMLEVVVQESRTAGT
ncbi:pyrrolidone-carboxylate peptidase [Rhodocista pekingensis]|uniref:Pyrrolidone-carboxylate peptidase n=1 Tax=Rhodocista pekingensis TaxID=201185 RepID=A0ABW2L044_9PROT